MSGDGVAKTLQALVMAEVAGSERKERQCYHLLISAFGQRTNL
jgi:hypothetical protein